jgi:hypothetical protein
VGFAATPIQTSSRPAGDSLQIPAPWRSHAADVPVTLVDSMATRTIVTSHPEVACDVCGRRLLRGEQPDVFLSSGQRRMVCELCVSRATQEGWRRDSGERTAGPRSERSQRGRSLLDRLRQSRWPIPDRSAEPVRAPALEGHAGAQEEWADIGGDWTGSDDDWDGAGEQAPEAEAEVEARPVAVAASGETGTGEQASVRRALEVFNAGEQPRRLAGVARSLGAPCVNATPVTDTDHVTIVVAWELCWYRYEVALEDELGGARLAAEGMELEELAPQERVANAVADERGALSPLDV